MNVGQTVCPTSTEVSTYTEWNRGSVSLQYY